MKTRMNNALDKTYEQDEFFKKWLVGLSERTKENHGNERMHDLTTEDMSEIVFEKFQAYKEDLS